MTDPEEQRVRLAIAALRDLTAPIERVNAAHGGEAVLNALINAAAAIAAANGAAGSAAAQMERVAALLRATPERFGAGELS